MKTTASAASKYLINKCIRLKRPVSNMFLNFMLFRFLESSYYSESPVMFDSVEAWAFGPVFPTVYYKYCGCGAMPITIIQNITDEEINSLTDEMRSNLDSIAEKYSKYQIYHWGDPKKRFPAWKYIYELRGDHSVIPPDIIHKYAKL